MQDDHTPVIVGVGEINDRPVDPSLGMEPLSLMGVALRRAASDAVGYARISELLSLIDSLDVVNFVSWRYDDPARQLCRQVGIEPRRAKYGALGGESPVRLLHEAALGIARGEYSACAVVGAEARNSVVKARKQGIELPWTRPSQIAPRCVRGEDILRPQSVRLGVDKPTTVYPFYEAATAAHWGQAPHEARKESAELWAKYAKVAERNPISWLRKSFSPDAIGTPSPDNRMIAWPYTKLQVANPTVNQGAAVIVMSLARAKAVGISNDRLIYVWGGANAHEPRDYLDRDQYYESHAQKAVLAAAREIAGPRGISFMELYSCFPCVPKMALRALGTARAISPTVTGGLTFFGAPLNNYMTHATCAMVRRLRLRRGAGLLYGQGEFLTKHQSLVISTNAPKRETSSWEPSVQANADRQRREVPPFVVKDSGRAFVETFTVIYGEGAEVRHGVVILRDAVGMRTIARVPSEDKRTLHALCDPGRTPVGLEGTLSPGHDHIANWSLMTN